MVTIVVHDNSLEISGHAHSNERGLDLVCAAISGIVLGAADVWFNNHNVAIEQKASGYLKIQFLNAILTKDLAMKAQFDFLIGQLSIMAKEQPEYVQFKRNNIKKG